MRDFSDIGRPSGGPSPEGRRWTQSGAKGTLRQCSGQAHEGPVSTEPACPSSAAARHLLPSGEGPPKAGRQGSHDFRGLRHSRIIALLLLILFTTPVVAQDTTVTAIDRLLEESQFEAAELAVETLEQIAPDSPDTLYLLSRISFFRGDYGAALEHANQAVMLSDSPESRLIAHRNLVESTFGVVSELEQYTTEAGHFVIFYDPSRDDVLLPLAEETLERAYAEIGFDFGYWPETPVRVEFYSQTSQLAQVSTLTEEQIETSGTIALCKYNRLMVTSPRAMLRGYGWRDTLSHEYVHYVIQQLTGTRIPIWLHEGLAKFEERRWRGSGSRQLAPSNQDLLASRIEADDLITFEQMHPSMALLPSQEDAGTAFAEVYTVIEFLYRDHDVEGLRSLVWAISDGSTVSEAFEQVAEVPFETFIEQWEEFLVEREYVRLPSDFVDSLEFLPDDASDAPVDELAGIAGDEARDYMHLGQLLRGRGRVEAAIVEYRKAESLIGSGNPVFQNWMARALLDLGRASETVDALSEAAVYYPNFYPTFLHLGEAHVTLSEPELAVGYLTEAASINPFDPAVYRHLSTAYEMLGETELAEQARYHYERTSR